MSLAVAVSWQSLVILYYDYFVLPERRIPTHHWTVIDRQCQGVYLRDASMLCRTYSSVQRYRRLGPFTCEEWKEKLAHSNKKHEILDKKGRSILKKS